MTEWLLFHFSFIFQPSIIFTCFCLFCFLFGKKIVKKTMRIQRVSFSLDLALLYMDFCTLLFIWFFYHIPHTGFNFLIPSVFWFKFQILSVEPEIIQVMEKNFNVQFFLFLLFSRLSFFHIRKPFWLKVNWYADSDYRTNTAEVRSCGVQ